MSDQSPPDRHAEPNGITPVDAGSSRSNRWRTRAAGLRIDTGPLRTSRDFRLLFAAGTVFYLGSMVSYVAVPYQLYMITGSNLAVGLLGAVELVPLVVFGLWGGALADHVDRRRLLVVTGVAQAVLMVVLMANALLPRRGSRSSTRSRACCPSSSRCSGRVARP